MKLKILNRWSGEVLFEYEKENNTIKDTVRKAVEEGVSLRSAYLNSAELDNLDLGNANLYDADLNNASLYNTDLINANLGHTDLWNANLCNANLYNADLYMADLSHAQLYNANLSHAKHVPYVPLACPSDGAFIGWKKVHGRLVKLEIPEDAKRSSATTNKCRCDKAKVLGITNIDGSNPIPEIMNLTQPHHVLYKVGEMVYPDEFDENRWNECSHGIHFFINKQDAIYY